MHCLPTPGVQGTPHQSAGRPVSAKECKDLEQRPGGRTYGVQAYYNQALPQVWGYSWHLGEADASAPYHVNVGHKWSLSEAWKDVRMSCLNILCTDQLRYGGQ